MRSRFVALMCAACWPLLVSAAQERPTLSLRTDFEGASLGKVEMLGDGVIRCHVVGQADERGRNRQASWYSFRIEGAKHRDLTLLLTNFVGEYNNKPGACAMNADTIPVFSMDGERWQHFSAMTWNDETKEATLKFRPEHDTIWIAHTPPYPASRLQRLLADIELQPSTHIQVVGRTVEGRDLHLVTVSEPRRPERVRRSVWLIARQHAWESGTSYVMEGAMRFITSKDPKAVALRRQVVFKFVPMMDPDGCAGGRVRFNANGYDVNRHWNEVNSREPRFARRMPEIWSVKRALFDWIDSHHSVDLMLNLHNTESTEYLQTQVDDPALLSRLQSFSERLVATTTFAPSRPLNVSSAPGDTTTSLWMERGVPVMLMEQRIGFNEKLKRRPTVEDRLAFGRELIATMAETVLGPADRR